MRRLRDIHPVTALAVLAAVAVFVKNAWVSEDAYIIFRSIEQLFAGHGPVWNPHERVQVFTSPLWFWTLAAVRVFSSHVFLNAIGMGLVLWLACLVVIRRMARSPGAFALIVLALLVSNGFADFTSSGLENSLLYFLLALFVLYYRQTGASQVDPTVLTRLWLVAGLIVVTRQDQVFLLLPALLGVSWRHRATWSGYTLTVRLLLGLGPLVAWTAFAVIYYGFPLPNTAYAKLSTGIDSFVLIRQGLKYCLTSLGLDTVTLLVIGVLVGWGRKVPQVRLLAAGVVLQLGYVVGIGGDFMQGRFLAASYLVAVLALVAVADWRLVQRRALWVGLGLYAALYPHTPLNVPPRYPVPAIVLGVADERGISNDALSVWQFIACRRERRRFPDLNWRRDAEAFRDGDDLVIVRANIGVFGYAAGTDKIIIDSLALADPLLARLPVTGSWRVGHYPREIPAGYVESFTANKNGGPGDARRDELSQDVILITRSPDLFSRARWRAILRQNF